MKKAREMKASPGSGWRREENRSGQGTWRITTLGTLIIIAGLLNKFHQPQINITFTSYVIPGTSETKLF